MAKQFPQGCDVGEEWRDNDEIGLYKPDDLPGAIDGSLNKKKTFQTLREKLQTAIENITTGLLTATGLLTVSDDGITSSSATINLKKSTTITGMVGTVEGRIDANSSDITALQGKVGQSLNTTDSVTFASVTATELIATGTSDMNILNLEIINPKLSLSYSQVYTEAQLHAILSSWVSATKPSMAVIGNVKYSSGVHYLCLGLTYRDSTTIRVTSFDTLVSSFSTVDVNSTDNNPCTITKMSIKSFTELL